jgi:hypothetical protein
MELAKSLRHVAKSLSLVVKSLCHNRYLAPEKMR